MKKSLIFFSIFIIAFIAFFDAKDRFEELDKAATNTPSQVEMKQMMDKPDELMNKDVIQKRKSVQSLKEKAEQDNTQTQQNQLDNIEKRRDTVRNQIP